MVRCNKVHTSNNIGEAAATAVIENLDSKDGDFLGYTPGVASNSTSAVSAVAISISSLAANEALDLFGTTPEILFSTKLVKWGHVWVKGWGWG